MHRVSVIVVMVLATIGAGNAQTPVPSSKVTLETETRGIPSATIEYTGGSARDLVLSERTPVSFTGLGVGWTSTVEGTQTDEFQIAIRTLNADGQWTDWSHVRGETAPEETPSGIYWSPLYITPDGGRHSAYEIRLTAPEGIGFASLRTTFADATYGSGLPPPQSSTGVKSGADLKPVIIPRSQWWGNLPAEYLNPTNYTPELITITHAIVHHTAGENNPVDPPQVIRNIWDFHVNGRGWSDIAYNFLLDQYGNIYHGRYNPWVDVTDVRGAHATYSNPVSVGISLLGNFEIPGAIPSSPALQSLKSVIAWRFDQRNLDPLTSADMASGGATVTLQRISGHRDVSATACPGATLYTQLPTIRTDVASIIEGSDLPPPVPGEYTLHQNYPNPFNPATTIDISLGQSGWVAIEVHDLIGRNFGLLTNRFYQAGNYTVTFDAGNLPAGPYFYTMQVNGYSSTRKMIIVR